MSVTPGTHLGPYEILSPLGVGGMGEVYGARDPRVDRDVAVKLVATDGTPPADRRRRFETEARAAAQLPTPASSLVTVTTASGSRPMMFSPPRRAASYRRHRKPVQDVPQTGGPASQQSTRILRVPGCAACSKASTACESG